MEFEDIVSAVTISGLSRMKAMRNTVCGVYYTQL